MTKPVLIATSGSEAPVLGIPRWKAYMQETAPANCWISLANDGGNSNNLLYSTNSGTSWSTNTINIDGYLDYHLSLFGQNGDLNFTFPRADGINFRRFNAPAHSENDAGPLVALPGTSSLHRSNIMLEPDGRIWIFTRRADAPAENVKYFTSTNGGTSWTSGTAWSTGANDVRIGSMPFVGGRPALIVEHLQDTRGFEYYLWNGTAFIAPSDHSIYAANMEILASLHPQRDQRYPTMHLIFGSGNNLIHVWKNYNGGNGTWNVGTVESSNFTADNEWSLFRPSTGATCDRYLQPQNGTDNASSSMIYYRKWSRAPIGAGAPPHRFPRRQYTYNRDANTCFHVPSSADYIPVFWSCGSTEIAAV